MSNVVHNLDTSEPQRLAAVRRYSGADVGPDQLFDRFTKLAAAMFEMPIALISLVGQDVVQFKSSYGADVTDLPRRNKLCDAVTNRGMAVVLHDALNDPLANDSRMVQTLGIRFYAGAPLKTDDGLTLGAFALADRVLRPDFDDQKIAMLGELARSVVAELELRRRLTEKRSMIAELSLRQEIAEITASAPSLTDALDTLLAHVGRRLGATYCAVSEGDPQTMTYRVMASHADLPEIAAILGQERRTAWRPLGELSCAAALSEQVAVDSGPVLVPEQVSDYPALAFAVSCGTRRQITMPIATDHRRFALTIGFREPELSGTFRATCADLVQWITPLLQGRLREDALARANALLSRSNRALQTVQASREAVARATDEAALTQAICDIAVKLGRYSAAWVGMAETDEGRTLRPVAMAGHGIDRIFDVHISWGDNVHGRGPSGTAVREARAVVIDDVMHTAALSVWHDDADLEGHVSAVALPLCDETGASFGCLTLLATDRAASVLPGDESFDGKEIRLLSQLAGDLAYGLCALRMRRARDAALVGRRDTEQRLTRLLEASQTLVYALERPNGTSDSMLWRVTDFSANIERLFGYGPAAVRAPNWWIDHVHPEDRDAAIRAVQRLLATGRIVHRYRFARSDGVYRWVRDEASVVIGSDGCPDQIVGAWVDITEKHQADAAIERLAYYDALTNLPNKALLLSHLAQFLVRARQSGMHSALMVLDLNGFEAINDLHGHATGDAVLRQIGRRLPAVVRKGDIVARVGDDKFAILLAGLDETQPRAAAIGKRIAEKVLATLAQPIHAVGHECRVSANIGIAMFPDGAHAIEDIMRQADMAVRQAKAGDRTPIVYFETRMQARVAERHLIEVALRDALIHDRFEVWLQSQVDQHGHITGAEALIRLRRPDGVLVSPDNFIAIAEETGMVFAMGRWMLRSVCRILAEQAARGRRLRVSINVSPRQFHDPDFIADIEAALIEAGADAQDLMIEITESLLIDRIDETRALLDALAARGIRFSVDDFGAGYSSLGYLQNLPIAEIKIDRSFIQRLPDNPRDATLAEAILSMTRHLGLTTVAEGVETEAQAAFLRARDCDMMQGYLFGRPEPAAAWLRGWGG
ncbi:EAL domain-containing protein [Acidiphilium sp. PA]|uniref:EAL domain-containing protein n=1 Tax=Acidiphilium sp. PA TaxID=2871705 RepID=UPI0022431FF5|nr:EAL domain-containing protein [Acidiphilium sp. PA]MCW8305871.1 EAL domain-containing protein [Acidiphilium sp. PA]